MDQSDYINNENNVDLVEDNQNKPTIRIKKPENSESRRRESRRFAIVLTLILVLGVGILFSIGQSTYVYLLSRGIIGNMTYENGIEEIPSSSEVEEEVTEPLPSPFFSLEEAASVHDPNKQTMTIPEIIADVDKSTVSIFVMAVDENGRSTELSSGSGFIISSDGYVVTNAHVVTEIDAKDYLFEVMLTGDDERIEATLIGADNQTDIAVIKLNEEREYPFVTLGDSTLLVQGELVIAIGNPLGYLDSTVTAGVVSALNRQVNFDGYVNTLIQTDASVNSGNSGGPLINSFGEVVGVVNAKVSTAEGIGFAIPISEVTDEIESLINYGRVVGRKYLGIVVKYIDEGDYNGAQSGVFVQELVPGGPGEAAGFKVGDRLVSADGVVINVSSDIIDVRDAKEIGDTIEFVVIRDGEEVTLELVIGEENSEN